MESLRCLICGEVYIGTARPSNCPFCGAKGKHLVPAEQWTDENDTVTALTEISRANLARSLQLEVNAGPFYRDASAKASSVNLQGVFKGLAKVESEHASVFRKILNCEFPAPEPAASVSQGDESEDLKVALAREVEATELYSRFADEAVEPRVKKVFAAISEVESGHITLENDITARRGGGA
jgi:rubrerythrin